MNPFAWYGILLWVRFCRRLFGKITVFALCFVDFIPGFLSSVDPICIIYSTSAVTYRVPPQRWPVHRDSQLRSPPASLSCDSSAWPSTTHLHTGEKHTPEVKGQRGQELTRGIIGKTKTSFSFSLKVTYHENLNFQFKCYNQEPVHLPTKKIER